MTADAARAALTALIDYAGLFPPARLEMKDAVAEYLAARSGEHNWMLGRFLCPASRLDELADLLRCRMAETDPAFRVRIVSDGEVGADIERALEFADAIPPRPPAGFGAPPPFSAGFDMFEVRWGRHGLNELLDAVFTISYVIPVVEVSPDGDVGGAVAALDAARTERGKLLLAKIRCGGLAADAFPAPEQVASFIGACSRAGLPFKATAGLHQPFRHFDPELGVVRHGFINVLAAAVLGCAHNLADATLARIVGDEDPASFRLDDRVLAWGDHEATAADIQALHWSSLVAYGSCNVAEPVQALTAAGILPVAAAPPPDLSRPEPVY